MTCQLQLGNRVAVHFVGTVGQAQGALVGVGVSQWEVVAHATRAVGLNRPIDDLCRHIGRNHFDHGDFGAGNFVADGVHHVGGFQGQQAGLFDHDARLGNALMPHALGADGFAKGHSAVEAFAHQFQRTFGAANGAHAVVNPAWA